MEAGWERGQAFATLTLEQAWRMLVPFGILPTAISLLAEGKANSNFRVETAQGPLVLRLYQRDRQARSVEAAIIDRLPLDFPTPRIVGRRPDFLLLEFFEGMSLERLLDRGKRFDVESVARKLAQAHLSLDGKRAVAAGLFSGLDRPDLPVRFEALEIGEPWPSAVEGLLGYLRFLLPKATLGQALDRWVLETVDAAEPRLQEIAGPPVLVHGDFKPSNLLVNRTDEISVLDWEFAHAGTRLSDIGQLFRFPESLPEGFEAAFCAEMGIDGDTILLARTLDLVNLVDFAAKSEGKPTLRRDVIAHIDEVCLRYQTRFGTGTA